MRATVLRLIAASWGQLANALVTLVALRFYSQWLDPAGFGLAMLLAGGLALLDGLGTMAFAQTLAHVLGEAAPGWPARLALARGLARWFAAWQALLGLVAIPLAGWALIWWGHGSIWPALAAVAAAWALSCVGEGWRVAGQTAAQLERRFGALSAWAAVEALATPLVTWLLMVRLGFGPVAVVAGALATRSLITWPAMLWLGRGQPLLPPAHQAARAQLRSAIGYGWSVALMAPLGWLGLFADRFIVGASAGLVPAGVLAALAGVVARPFAILSAALTTLLRPDLLDAAAGRAPVHRHPLRLWLVLAGSGGLAALGAILLIGGPVAGFLITFPTPGIDRRAVLTVLVLSQTAIVLTHALDNAVLARGAARRLLFSQSAAMVLGLPLIAFGALHAGALGAAWARTANEALKLALAALVLVRL